MQLKPVVLKMIVPNHQSCRRVYDMACIIHPDSMNINQGMGMDAVQSHFSQSLTGFIIACTD